LLSELAGPQHYQRAAFDHLDARLFGLFREGEILRAWIHDDPARSGFDDFVDERVRTRFAEVERDRVDRFGGVGNFLVTFFAQDLGEGGIDRDWPMPVL